MTDIFKKIAKKHEDIQKVAILGAIVRNPLKSLMAGLTVKEVSDHASNANKAVRDAKNISKIKAITKV